MMFKSFLTYFSRFNIFFIFINSSLISTFQFFGITDEIDYRKCKWTRGRYDTSELEKIYTADIKRCALVLNSVQKYVADMNDVKGLGFCVSVAHADFMATYFNSHGVPAISLSAKSMDDIRDDAKQDLISGKIKFIFVVDLYNEGVDIPQVNTILFLRPTESATVFLQQLGRGLRLSPGKDCLTVLDFIGQANKKYNFAMKFEAMAGKGRKSLQKQIEEGFSNLPRGCYIQLEKYAKEYVLENLRQMTDKTVIIVTHRPAALGICDRVLDFTENGIEEIGRTAAGCHKEGERDIHESHENQPAKRQGT